jgi:hypothetical protein
MSGAEFKYLEAAMRGAPVSFGFTLVQALPSHSYCSGDDANANAEKVKRLPKTKGIGDGRSDRGP